MSAISSAIYEGRVRHRRFAPVEHAFEYGVAMLYLDLDRLHEEFERWPLSSVGSATPLCFRDRDYVPDRVKELAEAVRDLVEQRTGERPTGPVRLLTHVRTFGHVFNPVSFYYCSNVDDTRVEAIVAEITNTPWRERHCYVMRPEHGDGRGSWFEFDKEFHVSPFLPMEQRYRWRFTPPGASLVVHMENHDPDPQRPLLRFDATLQLARRPLDRRGLARVLVRYPLMTAKVVAAIHWQALRLWVKRVPFFSHPSRRAGATMAATGSRSPRS